MHISRGFNIDQRHARSARNVLNSICFLVSLRLDGDRGLLEELQWTRECWNHQRPHAGKSIQILKYMAYRRCNIIISSDNINSTSKMAGVISTLFNFGISQSQSLHNLVEKTRSLFPSASASDAFIFDIRGKESSPQDLRAQCIQGLCQPSGSKSLPSLLLWDNKGQKLYADILKTTHYYPYRVENELLLQQNHDIAKKISSTGTEIMVELGAGNMQKTTLLLSALDALGLPLTYYALDVDQVELESSILALKARANLQNIKVHGLLGTYEDGARWLSTDDEIKSKRKMLLWLGNSIANRKMDEAGELLGSFIHPQDVHNISGFILGIDGCKDEPMLECAYDTPGGQSRKWVKYGLEAARNCLGPEAKELLDDDNWRFEGRWNPQNLRYENHLRAARSITCTIGENQISIRRGERVYVLGSSKWSMDEVSSIGAKEDLHIAKSWKSEEVDYSKSFYDKVWDS